MLLPFQLIFILLSLNLFIISAHILFPSIIFRPVLHNQRPRMHLRRSLEPDVPESIPFSPRCRSCCPAPRWPMYLRAFPTSWRRPGASCSGIADYKHSTVEGFERQTERKLHRRHSQAGVHRINHVKSIFETANLLRSTHAIVESAPRTLSIWPIIFLLFSMVVSSACCASMS